MNRAQILKYIKEDNLSLFKEIESNFIINYEDKNKDSILHLATQKGAKKIVSYLINHYPQLLLKKNNVRANFLTDAWFGLNDLTFELFETFKNQYPDIFNEYIESSLFQKDEDENSFLMKIVSLSEKHQFDIFKTYFLPSIMALTDEEKLQYFSIQNAQGKNVCHLIGYYGYEHLNELVLFLPNELFHVPQHYLSYTPLFEACEHGNLSVAQSIIEKEPNTLLDLSSYNSNVLFVAILSRKIEVVKFLIEKTTLNVFHKNCNQVDALTFSFKFGTPDIVNYLFDYFYQNKKICLDITKPHSDTLLQLFFNFSKNNIKLLPKLINYIKDNESGYIEMCNNFDYKEKFSDPLNQILRQGTLNDVKLMHEAGFKFIASHQQYIYAKDYYTVAISSKEALSKLDYVMKYDTNTSLSLDFNSVNSVFKKSISKGKKEDGILPSINLISSKIVNVLYENKKKYMSVNTFGWFLVPHLFNQYSLAKSQSLLKLIEKRKKISIYDLYLALLVSLYQQKQDKLDYLIQAIISKFDASQELKNLYELTTGMSYGVSHQNEKLQFIQFVLMTSTNIGRTKYLSLFNITHFENDFYLKNQFLIHLCTLFRDEYEDEFHMPSSKFIKYSNFREYYKSIYELDTIINLVPTQLANTININEITDLMINQKDEQIFYVFDKLSLLFDSYAKNFTQSDSAKKIALSSKKLKNPIKTIDFDYLTSEFYITILNKALRYNKVEILNYIYENYNLNSVSFIALFKINEESYIGNLNSPLHLSSILSHDVGEIIEKLRISDADKALFSALVIKALAIYTTDDAIWGYQKYHLIEKLMTFCNIQALVDVGLLDKNTKTNTLLLGEKKKNNLGDSAFTYSFIPLIKQMAQKEELNFSYDKYIIRKIAYTKNALLYYLFDENKDFLQSKNNVKNSLYMALGNKPRLSHRGKIIKDNVKLQNILLENLEIHSYSDLIISMNNNKTTLISKALIEAEFEVATSLFNKMQQAKVDFYNQNTDYGFESHLLNISSMSEYKKVETLLDYIQESKQFKDYEDPLYMVKKSVDYGLEACDHNELSQFKYSELNIYSLETHLHIAMKKSPQAFNSDNSYMFFKALSTIINFYIKEDAFYHSTIFNQYLFEVLEFLFSKMKREKLTESEDYMAYFHEKEDKVRQYFEKYLMESLIENEPIIIKKKMKI